MKRHLFIVSRDHGSLYAYLLERFNDDANVEVILDRRIADRRMTPSARDKETERRRADRRRAVPPEEDLRVRSHYVVER